MSKQLGLFLEFDEDFSLDGDFPLDYKFEIISLLELLLEDGEVSLLDDDISDQHIKLLIKFLQESNE